MHANPGRRPVLALGLVTLTVALAAALTGPTAWRTWIIEGVATPVRFVRSRQPGLPAGFDRLAISQLGFAPTDAKPFTSPVSFASVDVIDERTGQVAWRQPAPPRLVPSAVTGPGVPAVWVGDVTAFTRPGRYRLATDTGLSSPPFVIASSPFRETRRLVQRVFYFQRAFTAIEAGFAEGPWIHPSDATRAPDGVAGGWHDAGDYSVYNLTTVSSLVWLLQAARHFTPSDDATNVPESGNGLPDLLDEARWGLTWLLSVQTPEGAFRNSSCLEVYEGYGRNPPETGVRYVAGEPGTLPTARAVGVLGLAAHVYRDIDAAFAREALAAAWRGWRYLDARPGETSDGATCAAYRQDGDTSAGRAARAFAAAGMLTATSDPAFAQAFAAAPLDLEDEPSPYRFAAYAGLVYREAAGADPVRRAAVSAQLAASARRIAAGVESHPFGWSGRYAWGAIGIGAERAGLMASVCVDDPAANEAVCGAARSSLDYVFGRNGPGFSYVSGTPGAAVGRRHAFHHWLATLAATPFVFPGAVAGGPNAAPEPNDGSRPLARPVSVWGYWGDPAMPRTAGTPLEFRYTDNDSWSTNELAIAWQAPLLYGLYFAEWNERRRAAASGAGEVPAYAIGDAAGGPAVAVRIHR